MVRTRRDRALGRSASSIILAADGHGHGGPSSPPTRMTTTVTPALVEAKIAAQRYEKAKKVMRGKKAEHTAAFEGRVNVKCRYSDRVMLAICTLSEIQAGDIAWEAIESQIQKHAKIMMAPLGKLWRTSCRRAFTELITDNQWHSASDDRESMAICPAGRAKYVAVREMFPEPADESSGLKALRYYAMSREIMKKFDMLEKLTLAEVVAHNRDRRDRLLETRHAQGVRPEPSLLWRASDYQLSRENSLATIIEDNKQAPPSRLGSLYTTPIRRGTFVNELGSPSHSAPTLSSTPAPIPQGPTLLLLPSSSYETPVRSQHIPSNLVYPTPESNDRPRVHPEDNPFAQSLDSQMSDRSLALATIRHENAILRVANLDLRLDNEAYIRDIQELDARIHQQAITIENLSAVNNELNNVLREATSRMDEMNSKRDAEFHEYVRLQSEGDSIVAQIEGLLRAYDAKVEQSKSVMTRWLGSKEEAEKREEELKEKEMELGKLEEEVAKNTEELKAKERMIGVLNGNMEKLMEYCEALKKRIEDTDAAMLNLMRRGAVPEPDLRTPLA